MLFGGETLFTAESAFTLRSAETRNKLYRQSRVGHRADLRSGLHASSNQAGTEARPTILSSFTYNWTGGRLRGSQPA